MNIIEAINSRKYFKRKSWDFWCGKEDSHFFWINDIGKKFISYFQPSSILADDWVIDDMDYMKIKENIDYLISIKFSPDKYSDYYYGIKNEHN